MTCVGHYEGEPIWLSQCGWHQPEDEEVFFKITVGNRDSYPDDIPVIALIKRRR